jgi:hypothetical protein
LGAKNFHHLISDYFLSLINISGFLGAQFSGMAQSFPTLGVNEHWTDRIAEAAGEQNIASSCDSEKMPGKSEDNREQNRRSLL